MNDDQIYRLLKLLMRIIGSLPMGLADFLAHLFGLLWFKFDGRHRTVAIRNLTRAFGDEKSPEQIEILAKQSFKNIINILFEFAWSLKFDRETFLSHFTIKGVDRLKEVHARGNGVLGLLCHLGNFEMLIAGIEPAGVKGYAIYRQLDFAPLDRLIKEGRKRFNAEVIPTRGASKKAKAILKQGGSWAPFWTRMWTITRGRLWIFSGPRQPPTRGLPNWPWKPKPL